MLHDMRTLRLCLKTNTNFTFNEFEELCLLVVPIIVSNVKSIGIARLVSGRPSKLSP